MSVKVSDRAESENESVDTLNTPTHTGTVYSAQKTVYRASALSTVTVYSTLRKVAREGIEPSTSGL